MNIDEYYEDEDEDEYEEDGHEQENMITWAYACTKQFLVEISVTWVRCVVGLQMVNKHSKI